jgi:hypothetical protein
MCCIWRVIAHSTPEIWSRIQVTFPGRDKPLKPLLPSLLQAWLARSGSRPLTLRVVCEWHPRRQPSSHKQISFFPSADSQLLEILLSESWRWENAALMAPIYESSHDFDTPQLRTLRCSLSDLSRFNAPNLSHLYPRVPYLFNESKRSPTYEKILYLHLQEPIPCEIHSRCSLTWKPS